MISRILPRRLCREGGRREVHRRPASPWPSSCENITKGNIDVFQSLNRAPLQSSRVFECRDGKTNHRIKCIGRSGTPLLSDAPHSIATTRCCQPPSVCLSLPPLLQQSHFFATDRFATGSAARPRGLGM